MKQLLPVFFLAIIGCNKEDHSVKSSEKSISNVTFKKSDNPGLSTDIEGVVTSDSIKFDIPQNTSITSLIPTIEFKGQKIEPANRTAQDFTNGIRYKITAEDGSTNNYFFRVARISSDTSVLILGNWKVIKDSVVNNNWINPAGGVSIVPRPYCMLHTGMSSLLSGVMLYAPDPIMLFSLIENIPFDSNFQ